MAMNKKMMGLPMWVWLAIGGSLGVILYLRRSGSSSAANTGPAIFDPNAVDPNTGLTYGQEMGGGLPSTTGAGTPSSGSTGTTGQELGDITGLVTGLGGLIGAISQIAQQLQPPPAPPPPPGTPGTVGPPGSSPTIPKIPPPGAPKGSKWGGSKPPGKGWVGIGGGWWKPPPPKPKGKENSGSVTMHRNPASPRENVNAQAAHHFAPGTARDRLPAPRPVRATPPPRQVQAPHPPPEPKRHRMVPA